MQAGIKDINWFLENTFIKINAFEEWDIKLKNDRFIFSFELSFSLYPNLKISVRMEKGY